MDQNQNPLTDKPMERVLYEVKKIIVGQDKLLERLIVALLARGHILVEGVPGLAKTMAIKTLAGRRHENPNGLGQRSLNFRIQDQIADIR